MASKSFLIGHNYWNEIPGFCCYCNNYPSYPMVTMLWNLPDVFSDMLSELWLPKIQDFLITLVQIFPLCMCLPWRSSCLCNWKWRWTGNKATSDQNIFLFFNISCHINRSCIIVTVWFIGIKSIQICHWRIYLPINHILVHAANLAWVSVQKHRKCRSRVCLFCNLHSWLQQIDAIP